MQMNRNTRSRIEDVLVVLFCLSGTLFSIQSFIHDLNASLVRIDDTPVAAITFKYRTAQRRIVDRVLWDRLRQESPIYNGDTIRTADRSEATVHFPDGTSVELTGNTMVQVMVRDTGEREISLSSGTLVLSGGSGEQNTTLKSGATQLRVAAGSSLAVTGGEGNTARLTVMHGQVETASGDLVNTGQSALVSGDRVSSRSTVRVTEPRPLARYLSHRGEAVAVPFVWETDDSAGRVLEVSGTAGFERLHATLERPDGAGIPLAVGQWFWRIRSADGTVDAGGSLRIHNAPNPVAVAPAAEYSYRFRTRRPAVRFVWTANEFASLWVLTVADNPELRDPVISQRCVTPSAIISSLGAGRWYWQVVPWYPVNDTGFSGPSAVSRFDIVHGGDLLPPALQYPSPDTLVNTAEARGIRFSWRDSSDAANYRIVIADNPDLRQPVIDRTVTENTWLMDTPERNLSDGRWYWSVNQTDFEGNPSAFAPSGSFFALAGELVQRPLFPPDGYTIASNLAADTRFTWRSTVPGETRFQVSASADFARLQLDSIQAAGSTTVASLPAGTWYWRIASALGDLELTTPARRVDIAPPLDAPVLTVPEAAGRLVTRAGIPSVFSWRAVNGAQYYTLRIFRSGTDSDAVLERTWIEDTAVELALDALEEGSWFWTVQAFAPETALSTRRSGVLARGAFSLRRLRPVELVFPADGARIDGLDALLRPGQVRWTSVERPGEVRMLLSRSERGLDASSLEAGTGRPELFYEVTQASSAVQLPRLEAGRWWWTVAARTADGLDISPPVPRSFTVLAVPPLGPAGLLAPPAGTVFGPEYFSVNRQLRFSWSPVSGATHYSLAITGPDGRAVWTGERIPGLDFVLDDLAVLDTGTFTWTVEAVHLLEDGTVLQRGTPARATFRIDLPRMNAPGTRNRGALYGL